MFSACYLKQKLCRVKSILGIMAVMVRCNRSAVAGGNGGVVLC